MPIYHGHAEKASNFYKQNDVCVLCPRRCGVDRSRTAGYCGEGVGLRLASASIHRGEEPPLVGTGGSGTIFVSGCNLGCAFCQNGQISKKAPGAVLGREVNPAEFAEICLALQAHGAENINIVTGSHAVPAIAGGLRAARAAGCTLPALWNSSAYELPETLDLLRAADGSPLIDVFLPDLKTLDSVLAARYFNAPDYPEVATAAIRKMASMASGADFGVIVRHLVLPGCLESSREVLRWFAENCAGEAQLSLMFQYTPLAAPGGDTPDRYVTWEEYDAVLGWLDEFGIEDGFCQELTPGNRDWLPDFEKTNPFPSELSTPVWHWRTGFTVS